MEYGEAVGEFEQFFSNEIYEQVLEAKEQRKDSITVDVEEMDVFNIELYDYLRDNPEKAISSAEKGLLGVKELNSESFNVKFVNLPEEDSVLLKNIGAIHIGKYIPVEGLITDINDSKVEPASLIFGCSMCGELVEKEQTSEEVDSPYKCPDCGCKEFEIEEKNLQDVQEFTISSDNEDLKCAMKGNILGSKKEFLDKEVEVYTIPREDEGSIYLEVKAVKGLETSSDTDFNDEDFLSELVKDSFEINNIESFLDNIGPQKFEHLIAYIFEEAGWRTQVTQYSGDKGVDVIARKRFPVRQKFVIQAKYYSESTKVTPDEVQQYNSLKDQEPHTDQVFLITSSSYTKQAEELSEMLEIEILDREDVIGMLKDLKNYREEGVIEVENVDQEDEVTGEFDIDKLESGMSSEQGSRLQTVKQSISDLGKPEKMNSGEKFDVVALEDLFDEVKDEGIDRKNAEEIVNRLKRDGELFEPEEGKIARI